MKSRVDSGNSLISALILGKNIIHKVVFFSYQLANNPNELTSRDISAINPTVIGVM
jgi:hypothetical protein